MTSFATGRWNRDAGTCQGEIIFERLNAHNVSCWAVCHVHDFQGQPQQTTEAADADMEAHERQMFEARKHGIRFVRGRFE